MDLMTWFKSYIGIGVLNSAWFSNLHQYIICAIPIGMFFQFYKVVRADNQLIKGVSMPMFVLFLIAQVVIAVGSLIKMEPSIFWPMFIGAIVNIMIIFFMSLK